MFAPPIKQHPLQGPQADAARYVSLARRNGEALALRGALWSRMALAGGASPDFVKAVLVEARQRWESYVERALADEIAALPKKAGRPLGSLSADVPNNVGAGWQESTKGEDWLSAARADLEAIYGPEPVKATAPADRTLNDFARDGLGHAAEPLAATPAAISSAPETVATPLAPPTVSGATFSVHRALELVAREAEFGKSRARAPGRTPPVNPLAAGGTFSRNACNDRAWEQLSLFEYCEARAGPGCATHRASA